MISIEVLENIFDQINFNLFEGDPGIVGFPGMNGLPGLKVKIVAIYVPAFINAFGV